ncbi:FAD binding domain-containing protein [Melampsora americana]|nr:FAD binding domain-containing protein [Melampsora americana]
MSSPVSLTSNIAATSPSLDQKNSDLDVLIIGAGPAGLMAATCLARYGVHNVRIIDKRMTKIYLTLIFSTFCPTCFLCSYQILHALGMGTQILEESNELGEISFWEPSNTSRTLTRKCRIPATVPGHSRYVQRGIHQGRIERILMEKIASWSSRLVDSGKTQTYKPSISVERAICPSSLKLPSPTASALSDSPDDRIVVQLRHLTEAEAKPAQFSPLATDGLFRSNIFETDELDAAPKELPQNEVVEEVRCRYIIGTDGARSWTRSAIGYKLDGDSSNYFWGVIDGIPATDFPDIRLLCCLHSASSGSMLMIPRENHLVRLYVQLPQPPKGQRPNRSDITPEKLLKIANTILTPYTINIPKIEWYTCYEVGQRLVNNYSWADRIFLGGDACHTHSPKLAQGMNMSMSDTFNLTWKLAHVLQGKAHPKILRTYESERAPLGAELIEVDRKISGLFSGRPALDDVSGISLPEFRETMRKGSEFGTGIFIDYPSSELIVKQSDPNSKIKNKQDLAKRVVVGPRLASQQVVCLADAKPYHISDLIPADGKWKLLIFAGDIGEDLACKERLDRLARFLGESQEKSDSIIDCITILASARVSIEPDDFHDVLRPIKGKHGFRSYQKIFTDDESYHQGHGHAYEKYGIDSKIGCVVIVRPDQHVSLITGMDDYAGIAAFFDQFMLLPSPR